MKSNAKNDEIVLNHAVTPHFSRRKLARVSLAVAATVAALVFGASAVRFFSMGPVYLCKVRIMLAPRAHNATEVNLGPPASGTYSPLFMQTECEVMRCEVILAEVLSELGTNQPQRARQVGTRQSRDVPFGISQLKAQIEVCRVPNTNVIEVSVRDGDREEAVQIAKAIGETYVKYQDDSLKSVSPRGSSPLSATVMNRALTVSRPERLKTLLALARRAMGATLLGIAA